MIPVAPAPEPSSFHEHVRKRGADAVNRLLGKKVEGRGGRRPKARHTRAEEIPSYKFPAYWREPRKTDGRSALDDLMEAYVQYCAYLAMRIERATGSPTVDHFVPKSKDWKLVYEWSNYRLSAACVNGAKGTRDVVDPFEIEPGWFELDPDTFYVRRGLAPAVQHERIAETLIVLNLRQCVAQRAEFIIRYRERRIDLPHLELYAPFIAAELRRQGRLHPGDD